MITFSEVAFEELEVWLLVNNLVDESGTGFSFPFSLNVTIDSKHSNIEFRELRFPLSTLPLFPGCLFSSKLKADCERFGSERLESKSLVSVLIRSKSSSGTKPCFFGKA